MEAPIDVGPTSPEGDQQFGLLLDLMRRINEGHPEGTRPEHVFALVANALRQIVGIDRFAVVVMHEDGSLHITDSRGLSAEYLGVVEQHIGEGAGARALQQRKPMWIPDAVHDSEFWPLQEAAEAEGFRTVLILPLLSGSDPLGYLIMYHDAVRTYTPAEVALAQAMAQQAAFAVQNTRLLAATEAHRAELEHRFQKRVAEADAIDTIVLGISSSLDLGSTLQSIVDAAATLSGAYSAAIYLRDAAGNYRAMAAHGIPLEQLQKVVLTSEHGLIAQMDQTGEAVQVTDFSHEVSTTSEAHEAVAALGVRATLGVPLLHSTDVVGALYVASREPEPFPSETVRILKRLASFAQVTLQNAQRFSDVEAERSRLQAYVDAIPEGVIVFDRDGRVVLLNETLKREWGVRTPMVGLLREDVFRLPGQYSSRPLKFRFDPTAVFERVLATGKPEQGLLELEDSPRVFEMHFSALRRGAQEAGGIVATIRDVTVPLELGRERSRSHLLAQLLDISVVLNSNLSVSALMERVVEAAMTLIGAKSGTLGLVEEERLVFRRFHLPSGWIDFDVALREGEGAPGYVWQTVEAYVSNDCDSDPHVVSEIQQRLGFHRLATVPMVDSVGKVVGTLGVYDPIVERDFGKTDLEALQLLAHQAAIAIENARLNQLKDEFLSIVSHELKTPITSIKGFTQVLQRRLSPDSLERASRYLNVINHQADRLTALINDLLDLSRIQTGRFSFEATTVDYGVLVREVVAEMELMNSQNRITAAGPETVLVRGNAERLRQVLVNLIDNAVKHGPHGGAVQVTVKPEEREIVTCVRDEGRGLPPGEEERVFRPYYQVRPGTPLEPLQQAKGLGLGLYITRRIVEEHAGRIWLDDQDHTTFCFALPRAG